MAAHTGKHPLILCMLHEYVTDVSRNMAVENASERQGFRRGTAIMLYTAYLVDKSIVFICCIAFYLCQNELDASVVTALISVIFSGFLSYFDDNRIRTALTVGFSVLSCFAPHLIFFMPLIAYDMIFSKYELVNLLAVIPLLCFFRTSSLLISAVIIIMLSFSMFIRYRTQSMIRLLDRYNSLSHSAREMTIKLKKQNTEILEKQDYMLNLATLNERNRIAREIHDGVGHLLSSAILQVGALLTICKEENIRENLQVLNSTLTQAMNNIRTSVHELYDESIDLNAEIRNLVKQFNFCEITYDYNIESNPGKKLKYTFIFIVKEALANIIKHSNATHASIIFREHPGLYQLIIRDNGKVKSYSTDEGMGIRNMADRVESLGGNINISTENGFQIFISVPKGRIED